MRINYDYHYIVSLTAVGGLVGVPQLACLDTDNGILGRPGRAETSCTALLTDRIFVGSRDPKPPCGVGENTAELALPSPSFCTVRVKSSISSLSSTKYDFFY